MPNPTKTITAPPRIKPTATRQYRKPKYQAGGEIKLLHAEPIYPDEDKANRKLLLLTEGLPDE